MKKLILLGSIALLGCLAYVQGNSIILNSLPSKISLSNILLISNAEGEDLPPGYILLEEYGLIAEGYYEGEYWIEPEYGCVDANDKCLHL